MVGVCGSIAPEHRVQVSKVSLEPAAHSGYFQQYEATDKAIWSYHLGASYTTVLIRLFAAFASFLLQLYKHCFCCLVH